MQENKESLMPFRWKMSIAAYITVLNIFLVTSLISIWPTAQSEMTSSLGLDRRYLIMVALVGALGSYIHLATSFVEHAGRKGLSLQWTWWYFIRPLIGSALALIVYFVLRAGLIAGPAETTTSSTNPYGIAALSALAGLFSRQAIEKLRDVFENVCSVQRSESASGAPVVESPEP